MWGLSECGGSELLRSPLYGYWFILSSYLQD
jgi:hypothetical protein